MTLTAVGGHLQRPRPDVEPPQIAETYVEREREEEKRKTFTVHHDTHTYFIFYVKNYI